MINLMRDPFKWTISLIIIKSHYYLKNVITERTGIAVSIHKYTVKNNVYVRYNLVTYIF